VRAYAHVVAPVIVRKHVPYLVFQGTGAHHIRILDNGTIVVKDKLGVKCIAVAKDAYCAACNRQRRDLQPRRMSVMPR
jgi:hypothetical protein